MANKKSFDVLNINNKDNNEDIIQCLLGKDCLGMEKTNSISKLYFNDGKKDKIETQLNNINLSIPIKWKWEKKYNEDWHLTWQKNFKPVIINNKLAVIPYWQENSKENIVIKIKPGMAFGTGHHETTWLMLQQIMVNVKPNMSVLDLGTGSGILSIAAFKMGAKIVDSIENDKDCLNNFNENLNLNNIESKIQYYEQNLINWDQFDYDVILANINKHVIKKLIPKLKHNKNTIILSGLLETDYISINKLCNKYNLKIKKKFTKGEWICITL